MRTALMISNLLTKLLCKSAFCRLALLNLTLNDEPFMEICNLARSDPHKKCSNAGSRVGFFFIVSSIHVHKVFQTKYCHNRLSKYFNRLSLRLPH